MGQYMTDVIKGTEQMVQNLRVTKRNGSLEPLNYDKIHFVVEESMKGVSGVSVSDVEMNADMLMYDGIPTSEIHDNLIKAARDLITEKSPNYEIVTGNLINYQLRKSVWGSVVPPGLKTVIESNIAGGRYDPLLRERYTDEEIATIQKFIDHDRDYIFKAAGIQQVIDKYLVRCRVSEVIYETPQFMYIGVAMATFIDYDKLYDKATRLSYIRRYYDAISKHKINLPTPIMCGARTPLRQYASCVLVDIADDMDSIIHSMAAIQKYTSQRAGIGINMGRIRGLGSSIRGGEVEHTGLLPFIQQAQANVRSCTQNGVRGGGATTFYPFWHQEIRTIIVLKNNKGTEENRARKLDYTVQFNQTFYKRLLANKDISLFSPHDVPELYEHFGNPELFDKLYEEAERNPNIKRTTMPAMELATEYVIQRAETGRIYDQNIDHSNTHSSFKTPIRQSNLCVEITIPTKPIYDYHDENGEIALCVLSAFNLGAIHSLDELSELADLIVRALDEIIDVQEYPVPAARIATQNRRTLGVGFIGTAHFIARNGHKFCSRETVNLMHTVAERTQYELIKASALLAKDKGPCGWFNDTKYSDGIFPIDTYKKDVDTVHDVQLTQDWDALRDLVKQYGMRNSGLTAQMPSESSSVVSNETNGIEAPRGPVAYKKSKRGILRMVVPEYSKLKKHYQYVWDETYSNELYFHMVAVIQKFFDQSISANEYADPARYPNGMIPVKEFIRNMITRYKLGFKTVYYFNTNDGKEDPESAASAEAEDCASGACKI